MINDDLKFESSLYCSQFRVQIQRQILTNHDNRKIRVPSLTTNNSFCCIAYEFLQNRSVSKTCGFATW
jgi:hypothetical protein